MHGLITIHNTTLVYPVRKVSPFTQVEKTKLILKLLSQPRYTYMYMLLFFFLLISHLKTCTCTLMYVCTCTYVAFIYMYIRIYMYSLQKEYTHAPDHHGCIHTHYEHPQDPPSPFISPRGKLCRVIFAKYLLEATFMFSHLLMYMHVAG